MLGRWLLVAALALAGPAWAAKVRPGYRPNPGELCGGYPNVPMQMAKGFCAGIVVAPPPAGLFASKRQIHLPRTLLAQQVPNLQAPNPRRIDVHHHIVPPAYVDAVKRAKLDNPPMTSWTLQSAEYPQLR